jgi:hypothetical protein
MGEGFAGLLLGVEAELFDCSINWTFRPSAYARP